MTYFEAKQRLDKWYEGEIVDISPEVLDCCYDAINSKIQKKPKIVSKCSPNAFNGWYDYHCPICNQKFGTTNNPHKVKFCYECGQAIDWEY